ncbi:MAG: phage tail protein [Bacteroidetes bacterium]|nr:phage tail protein [Bacteroidota bacterium]MCW5896572.1 phage tail protein [Bacteroidota bacterium]
MAKQSAAAIQRNDPYGNFNYLVNLGTNDPQSVQAGFAEVVLPDISIDVIEYRNGNERVSETRKLPGRAHYGSVTLKRGVIGSLDLYQWIDQVRNGNSNAFRNVTISLQNEDRTNIVMTWKFRKAWPVRYSFSALQAKGKEVLVESLELAFDRMEME